MVKINSTDLKGFKLVLTNGKESYPLATLGSEIPQETINPKTGKPTEYAKSGMKLHLTAGDKWAGDIVAELPDNKFLLMKGSLYSRNALLESKAKKVGSIG